MQIELPTVSFWPILIDYNFLSFLSLLFLFIGIKRYFILKYSGVFNQFIRRVSPLYKLPTFWSINSQLFFFNQWKKIFSLLTNVLIVAYYIFIFLHHLLKKVYFIWRCFVTFLNDSYISEMKYSNIKAKVINTLYSWVIK